jgi:hypothetical protein
MALPIAATPTLEGEDALRFYRELEENEGKLVSEEEVRSGIEIYNAIMKYDLKPYSDKLLIDSYANR